jgi:hypothetical protein
LKDSDERFFILMGEPEVGESAIAAQITQIRDDVAAYHFCIAGRSGTIEPNNVLLSLAAQLVEYFPDYAETLANIIKPLKLSVNVEITIQSIKDSTVMGVVINNLHTQNPQEALNIILRQALAALPNPPEQPRLILIDSLDEAVTFGDRDNLITLLAGLDDLPTWVRLLVTSRPEDRVLVEFEPLEPHRIEEMSEKNLSDIREYVEGRLEWPALQGQLSNAALELPTLIDEITRLSSGNFLYTKLLLNDIEAGRQPLDDLSALPRSIDEIYLAFLRRFKPQEWRDQYQPILGTLTVTQEPVTEDELANFTKIRPRILRQDLGIIRQFLDVLESAEGNTVYAIFHQSLRDYLLNKKRNKYFWCDAHEQHDLIINYYRDSKESWDQVALEGVDQYGRKHLAQHLVKADRAEELHELLSLEKDGKNAWFKVKDDEGDTAGFLADLELAWLQADAVSDRELGRSVGLQCRYALIKASINSMTGIPKELIVALVKHSYWKLPKAFTYVRLIPDPKDRFESLISLVILCPSSDLLKTQILQSALETAQVIRDEFSRANALIVLADKLTPALLPKALDAAFHITHERYCANTVIALANKLPETLFNAVISDLYSAIHITSALRLPNVALDKLTSKMLLKVALECGGLEFNTKALIEKLTPDLIPKALDAALAIEYEHARVRVLIALVDKLTPDLLPKALDAALAFEDQDDRAMALIAFANKLTPDVVPKALNALEALARTFNGEMLVCNLTPDLLPMPKNIEAAYAFKYEQELALLKALTNKLTPELLPRVWNAALNYNRNSDADALIALADKLTPDLIPKALDALEAHTFNDKNSAEILTSLVSKLTPDLLPKALDAALAFRYSPNALIALANKLTPDLIPKALDAALAFEYEDYRAAALIALANKLTPDLIPKALAWIIHKRAEKKEKESVKRFRIRLSRVFVHLFCHDRV